MGAAGPLSRFTVLDLTRVRSGRLPFASLLIGVPMSSKSSSPVTRLMTSRVVRLNSPTIKIRIATSAASPLI